MPKLPGEYRLGYRADIEGLRAVAILLVVACHAKVPWLAGGFVGVDVFYVLSGYLITGLLVQETHATGELRFANFYVRRLRRLLPALLLMLAVTCILGRLLLAPGGQPEQASAAASAALWLSNFHFAFSNMGYFAPGPETNLFLHTWSLGVEEQFYLVWPLLVVLAMGAWEGAKRPPDARRLKWLFGGIFAISFVVSLFWTHNSPHLAFYMMPARAWQFALGALVFLLVGSPGWRPDRTIPGQRWLPLAGWLGLAAILLAAFTINGGMPYPGVVSLLPTAGAALVLATGARGENSGAGHILSLRPMQGIGRVSYSWYLWHWPVLLLGATLLDVKNGWIRLALVVLSFVLAALSYRYFETPIRRNRKLLLKPRFAVFAALAMMVLAGSFALRWHAGAMARMETPEQLRFEAAHFDAPVIYRTDLDCDDWYRSANVRICAFGQANAAHTAVAIGDSVALQWFPAYARIFGKPGWRLLVITKSSCPMVDEPMFYARIGREYTECARWRAAALRDIAALKPDVIVLGSTLYGFSQAQWITGTRHILSELAPAARHVYLMRATPRLPFDGPSCLAPRSALYRVLAGSSRCTAPAYDSYGAKVFQWLKVAASPYKNVHVIDMTNSVCPHDVCHAEIDGRIVFRDGEHMTATFAASLAPALARAFSSSDSTALRTPDHPEPSSATARTQP